MASLRTPTAPEGGQGIIRVLSISSCVTGDTVSYKNKVTSWKGVNKTTTDALTVTYDRTTQLFTCTVANTPDIDIWVLS